MNEPLNEVEAVIEQAGGIGAVSRLVGCTHQAVILWIKNNRFPTRPGLVERTIRAEAERRTREAKEARAPRAPSRRVALDTPMVDGMADGTDGTVAKRA